MHRQPFVQLVFFLSVFLAPCLATSKTPETQMQRPPPGCQIGPVTANRLFSETTPNGYCVEGRFHRGATHRIGRMNVFGPHGLGSIEDGEYALMVGAIETDLFAQLKDEGPCPSDPPFRGQWRGDWYADEGGYSNTETNLRAASFMVSQTPARIIPVLKYSPPPPLRPRRENRRNPTPSEITLTLGNPFSVPLEGITLTLHYEGGPGKPSSQNSERNIDLVPGEFKILVVPRRIDRDGEKWTTGGPFWSFRSASLAGEAGGCTFWPRLRRETPSFIPRKR